MQFLELIRKARYIGVDEIAYPIDIFSIATELSEHPDTPENIDQLALLVADPQNYFTRWAAARAINQMGPEYILLAKETLLAQAKVENYELAKDEITSALGKI